VIEGLLGGLSTITATINAYLSDVTPDGSRAAVFARLAGITMVGFASGPVLGSLLIKFSGNMFVFQLDSSSSLINSMMPFYVSVCVHAMFICLILFLLPESLSSESRQILSKNAELARAAAQRQDALDREWESTPRYRGGPSERDPLLHNDSTFSRISGTDATHSRRRKRIVGNARRIFRRLFSFLQPLTVFAPRETEDGGKDWNLTKVGAGMFLIGCLYVSYHGAELD
jgi:MFS family permease